MYYQSCLINLEKKWLRTVHVASSDFVALNERFLPYQKMTVDAYVDVQIKNFEIFVQ